MEQRAKVRFAEPKDDVEVRVSEKKRTTKKPSDGKVKVSQISQESISWSPDSHSLFPISVRKSARWLFLLKELRPGLVNELPTELFSEVVSFMHVHNRKLYLMNSIRFDVPASYRLISHTKYASNPGSDRVLCAGLHEATERKITVVKCTRVIEEDQAHILKELMVLTTLKHPNVLSIHDVFAPREGNASFVDIYYVVDRLNTTLEAVLKSEMIITRDHIIYFIYQILCGLKFLHSAGIHHKNLSPAECYLSMSSELMIQWFAGDSSVLQMERRGKVLPHALVYRAPESLIDRETVDTAAADIWSAGCILGELMKRTPLFNGNGYIQQLTQIFGRVPDADTDLQWITHESAKLFTAGLPRCKSWDVLFLDKVDSELTNLLGSMLQFNPASRATASELLSHPTLSMVMVHEPSDEPEFQGSRKWEAVANSLSSPSLRSELWKIAEQYNVATE